MRDSRTSTSSSSSRGHAGTAMAGPPAASSHAQRERTPAGSVLTRSPSRSRSGSPIPTGHSHSQGSSFQLAPKGAIPPVNAPADRNSTPFSSASSSKSSSARSSSTGSSDAGANPGRSSGASAVKGGPQKPASAGGGTGVQASRRSSAPVSNAGNSTFTFPSTSGPSASTLGTPSLLVPPPQQSLLPPYPTPSAFEHLFLFPSPTLASLPRRPFSFSSAFFPGASTLPNSHSRSHTQRGPARSSSVASFPFFRKPSLGSLGTPYPSPWGAGLHPSGRKGARSLCGASCLITTVVLLLCASFLTPFALQDTPALSLDAGGGGGPGLTQASAQRIARFTRSRNKQGANPLPWQYGIIIDAGSSGTRVHVFPYRFPARRGQTGGRQAGAGAGHESEHPAHEDSKGGRRGGLGGNSERGEKGDGGGVGPGAGEADKKFLLPEFQPNHATMKVRPGLSFYRDDPASAAQSLLPLLHFAKTKVPQAQWRSTPVRLMATAGLRRLDPETASAILGACAQELLNSDFLTPGALASGSVPGNPGSAAVHPHMGQVASIIPGAWEGVYAWVAANAAAGTLTGDPRDTIGIIELGGASLQVTFVPPEEPPAPYGVPLSLPGVHCTLYSHSFLGLGQDAAAVAAAVVGDARRGATDEPHPCHPIPLPPPPAASRRLLAHSETHSDAQSDTHTDRYSDRPSDPHTNRGRVSHKNGTHSNRGSRPWKSSDSSSSRHAIHARRHITNSRISGSSSTDNSRTDSRSTDDSGTDNSSVISGFSADHRLHWASRQLLAFEGQGRGVPQAHLSVSPVPQTVPQNVSQKASHRVPGIVSQGASQDATQASPEPPANATVTVAPKAQPHPHAASQGSPAHLLSQVTGPGEGGKGGSQLSQPREVRQLQRGEPHRQGIEGVGYGATAQAGGSAGTQAVTGTVTQERVSIVTHVTNGTVTGKGNSIVTGEGGSTVTQGKLSAVTERGPRAVPQEAKRRRGGNFTLCKRVASRVIGVSRLIRDPNALQQASSTLTSSLSSSSAGALTSSSVAAAEAEPCPFKRCPIRNVYVPELSGLFLATENFYFTAKYLKLKPSSTLGEFAEAAAALCENSERGQQPNSAHGQHTNLHPPGNATTSLNEQHQQRSQQSQLQQNSSYTSDQSQQRRLQQDQRGESTQMGGGGQQGEPGGGVSRRHVELAKYCFAASYAVAFLHEGLGVSLHDTRLRFTNFVKGQSVDWALGALILDLLNSSHPEPPSGPMDPRLASSATSLSDGAGSQHSDASRAGDPLVDRGRAGGGRGGAGARGLVMWDLRWWVPALALALCCFLGLGLRLFHGVLKRWSPNGGAKDTGRWWSQPVGTTIYDLEKGRYITSVPRAPMSRSR